MKALIALLLVVVALVAAPSHRAAAQQRPNIVLILADDAGVETIGAYGSELATPRIDALARQGVRFENAHATPLCAPSRVRLLTGHYSFRNYKAFGHLDPSIDTLAKALQRAGYRTAVVGKWQMSGNPLDGVPGASPVAAGFDHYATWHTQPRGASCRYWSPKLSIDGEERVFEDLYGPDLVGRFAREFIAADTSQPFFLFYSMILPHDPWVPTPHAPAADDDAAKFRAMIEYMDLQVGRLLDELDALELREQTLVVFAADNGTDPRMTVRRNGVEVAGGKGSTLDTGTHVPLVMSWPDTLPAGAINAGMVDFVDVHATLLAAAQATARSETDGLNLLAALARGEDAGRAAIFMDYALAWWPLEPVRYAFTPRWKLYEDGRMFDVLEDPREAAPISQQDLAADARAARSNLQALLDRMGRHPLTLADPYFPQGFDPQAVDYASASYASEAADCPPPANARGSTD